MKKLLIVAVVASLFSLSSFAEDKSDGCGLGWQVTKKLSLVATTTRGTTNSVVPNTFGMTSGTLGCTRHSIVKNDAAPLYFAEANYENLVVEMALGQGEYLNGFAATMGCDSTSFSKAVQSNYHSIIKSENTTPAQLLKAARSYCTRV